MLNGWYLVGRRRNIRPPIFCRPALERPLAGRRATARMWARDSQARRVARSLVRQQTELSMFKAAEGPVKRSLLADSEGQWLFV